MEIKFDCVGAVGSVEGAVRENYQRKCLNLFLHKFHDKQNSPDKTLPLEVKIHKSICFRITVYSRI